jgi:hypothetical protein
LNHGEIESEIYFGTGGKQFVSLQKK